MVTLAALSLSLLGCVESGEIAVRNSTDRAIIVVAHSGDCLALPKSQSSKAVDAGQEEEFVVVSGSWIGDACLSVLTPSRVSVEVSPGRLYEVTQDELAVRDVGSHDEPWYFDLQRYDWSWSSRWVWFYLVPILVGAPVGLFVTARFFYRFYVLKQE